MPRRPVGRKKLFHIEPRDAVAFIPGSEVGEHIARTFRRYHWEFLISIRNAVLGRGIPAREMHADQVVVHTGKTGRGRQQIILGLHEIEREKR